MTHDPLCLCAEDESRCAHCWDDCACGCFDIRRVRPVIVNAALDAAQEAIRNREDGDYFPWPQVLIATAAIQDLQP